MISRSNAFPKSGLEERRSDATEEGPDISGQDWGVELNPIRDQLVAQGWIPVVSGDFGFAVSVSDDFIEDVSLRNIRRLYMTRKRHGEWLVSYAGDRFLAGTPALDTQSEVWLVPILYVYPKEGPLGSVGKIAVNSVTGELSAHPPIEEIKRLALDLYRV